MRKKKIKVPKSIVGNNCHYIGNIKGLSRIVYYEGIILEELGSKLKCQMIDRNIFQEKKEFIIFLEKSKVN